MNGHIVQRVLKSRTAYEAYVRHEKKQMYIGMFGTKKQARKAQREAHQLLKQGQRPSPPPVPRMQVGDEGVTSRVLIDGTIVYDINVTVKRERDSVQSFRTKVEAIAARKAWLEHINAGDLSFRPTTQPLPKQKPHGAELKMDPKPTPDILFGDYAFRWYEARHELWAPATLAENRSLVGRYLNKVVEDVEVRAITHSHLTALEALMAKENLSDLRRSKVRRLLIKILSSAVLDGLQPSNPASYGWCRTGKVGA